eukprot:1143892-Pelagomonas_calceolata.AAC.11
MLKKVLECSALCVCWSSREGKQSSKGLHYPKGASFKCPGHEHGAGIHDLPKSVVASTHALNTFCGSRRKWVVGQQAQSQDLILMPQQETQSQPISTCTGLLKLP